MKDVNSVISQLLSEKAPQNDEILSGSKSEVARAISKVHQAKQQTRSKYVERKMLRGRTHVVPDITMDASKEKMLLRIATKGVVTLFNALSQQQREMAREDEPVAKKAKVDSMSKSNFLEMLRKGAQGPAQITPDTKEHWDVLDDDFANNMSDEEEANKQGDGEEDFFRSDSE